MRVKILPTYASIECVRDICEVWIEAWSGDEWGESMDSLLSASHTSYGLDDEDCAVLARMLIRNLGVMKKWMDAEGRSYGLTSDELEAKLQERSRELREYWRKGGNLGSWEPAELAANETLDTLPGWLFGE